VAAGLSLTEQFIALFNNLKEAAGTPERMRIFYKDSKAIRSAFHALDEFLARTDFERRVIYGGKIFIPRAAGFETAWKEHAAKWRFRVVWPEAEVSSFSIADFLIEEDFEPDPSIPHPNPSIAQDERRWRGEQIEPEPPTAEDELDSPDPELEDSFDPRRHDGGAAIQLGIEWLDVETESDDRVGNSCRLAIGAYDYLTETIGLNLYDVFRRWRKVPVVFMPAHVANRYGASDKGSLLHLLDDAVRAYVVGAPAAAILTCRAALETVLKGHYGHGQWEDAKLGKLVVLASQRYNFKKERSSRLCNWQIASPMIIQKLNAFRRKMIEQFSIFSKH
jgi:hypothetical protein